MRRVLQTVAFLLVVALPAQAVAIDRPSRGAQGDLLPALEPVRADLADFDLHRTKGGKVLLRFIGSIGNHGRGVLHVHGSRSASRDAEMVAYQRISRSDGSTRQVRIGKMVYHTEHNHFHLEGVARYRLLDAEGNPVKEAAKVTFCLMDSQPVDDRLEGFEPHPSFHQCAPSPSATTADMGISIGWADVYDKQTPGQSFDVTDLARLPEQDYTLEMTVDPQRMLQQANGPRTTSVRVKIGRG